MSSTLPRNKKPIFTLSLAIICALLFGALAPFSLQPVQADGVPLPLSPLDGTVTTSTNYPPLGIPEVSWTSVPETTLYRLQFSSDIGFSTIALDVTTANTRYTPVNVTTSLFKDGDWFWRVRVEKPTVGSYSNQMHFEKKWGNLENVPLLTHPDVDAYLDFYTSPTFSWQPAAGAASYRFQIATSPDGFGTPTFKVDNILTTSYQPLLKLANGLYYWQVVPFDPGSNAGSPSEARAFSLSYGEGAYYAIESPALIEPADLANPTFTPTFRWKAVPGAEKYTLEYTSAPLCNFSTSTRIETRMTTYTPTSNFPNDQNYCWHVRAHSGLSISEWSDTWEVTKKWYIKPELLTPTTLHQYVNIPYFSWTPVPGASRYRIEVNTANSFPPPTNIGNCQFSATTANTHFFHYQSTVCVPYPETTYFWRVIPVDANNNDGRPSDVKQFTGGFGAPQLIYPLYYYSYPPASYGPDAELNPHEDRSIAFPLFQWHRLMDIDVVDQTPAYQLQVNPDTPYFDNIVWDITTENLSAVPLASEFSSLEAGREYFWRIKAVWGDGRDEPWSQIWKTRIDPEKMLPSAGNMTGPVTLLRPLHGSEVVETTPLLEWFPLNGAVSYEVQISRDVDFATENLQEVVNGSTTAEVAYPAFTPRLQLDYDLNETTSELPYGTYYWRVRGVSSDTSTGSWSTPWRFQVAAQSNWRLSRTLGELVNDPERLIASNPADGPAGYELTSLYAAQSGGAASNWYFGFHAEPTEGAVYALYIDLDHQDGSGASFDAEGFSVTTINDHQPEYAIYITPQAGTFTASQVKIYPWLEGSNAWDYYNLLNAIDGELYFDDTSNYVEIRVPDTAIGMEATTSSASLAMFSINTASDLVQDTLPQGDSAILNRFTSVSDKLTLATPGSTQSGDPTQIPSILPFSWHLPLDVPWFGFQFEIGIDPLLTTYLYRLTVYGSNRAYPAFTYFEDFSGDQTYYWRVRPLYIWTPSPIYGAWSEINRFERLGLVPTNLQESVTFATPTFSWTRVEGAESYTLQVSSNLTFTDLKINNLVTTQNSYTPQATLQPGTYYWRVRANRYQGINNDWSPAKSFTLSLPSPQGLRLVPATANNETTYAPTMCWDTLLETNLADEPILAAWKYRLQTSTSDTFTAAYEQVDTEQTCYTPAKSYPDGTYYWRLAMIDGNVKLGPWSTVGSFTKQYPIPILVGPSQGTAIEATPSFEWLPVQGAARYRIEIADNPNFSPVVEALTTVNTRYSSVKLYDPSKTYYFRVQMIDRENKPGPFTGAVMLTPTPSGSNQIFLPLTLREQ